MRDVVGGPWGEVLQDLLITFAVLVVLVVVVQALSGGPLVSATFLLALPVAFVALVGLIALLRRYGSSNRRSAP
jgi:uncharacterized membrane protein